MGMLLLEHGFLPDLIITSSAERARNTAILIANSFDFSGQIEETREFYHADPRQYIDRLHRLPDEIQTAMIVGHNPGMEELIEDLTGRWRRFPTAAIAVIDLPIQDWSAFDLDAEGILRNYWLPKEIDR
jgi:phosphohistidine phosphatase